MRPREPRTTANGATNGKRGLSHSISGKGAVEVADRRAQLYFQGAYHAAFRRGALITDITPQNVENFIAALKRKGLKNKTVKNIITDFRAMFNWAMEPRGYSPACRETR